MSDQEAREQFQRIETLIQRFDQSSDPHAKADAAQLVEALMDLHSTALARIVTLLMDRGEDGSEILRQLGEDETVSGLLVLYGLHPVSLGDRVRIAIEELQPFLKSKQATLELVSMEQGALTLRIVASGEGCHSHNGQLKQVVEDAIVGAAPDLTSLTIEQAAPQPKIVFVPLESLQKRRQLTANSGPVATA